MENNFTLITPQYFKQQITQVNYKMNYLWNAIWMVQMCQPEYFLEMFEG